MPTNAPSFEILSNRLSALRSRFQPLDATGYRSATPDYSNVHDLLSGEGSRIHGGRWNPKGIAAVYASLSPETAMMESVAHFRYYGFGDSAAMPRVFVAAEFRLKLVLDLTDEDVLRAIGVSADQLRHVDWRKEVDAGREPLTQRLGRAAHSHDIEGLLVPSGADSEGRNLVAFPENCAAHSTLKIINPDRLSTK
jgi:RES domain-containing protein